MRRIATIVLAVLLGTSTFAWGMPVQGEDRSGKVAFQTYCAECHRPADFRRLWLRYGAPLGWDRLTPLVDPPPDYFGPREDHGCNAHLRSAFARQRFAAAIRRGTLVEIFGFLDGLQSHRPAAHPPAE